MLGYRAASFSITRDSLWALDVLIDLGFHYDSSIFPIHHDLYGLPGATPEPHRISAPSGRTLAEFPMSTASFFGLRVPVSGGGYFRILPYWLTRAGLRQINEQRERPFAFYLHPWELDPGQPRFRVGAFSRFRHYTNLSRCEARLRAGARGLCLHHDARSAAAARAAWRSNAPPLRGRGGRRCLSRPGVCRQGNPHQKTAVRGVRGRDRSPV